MERIEQAIILAAGEGQRLRPFTASKPKVMIPIANKPILRYVIEAVAQNGIRKIVIVVGYRKDQVIDYFGSGEQFDVEIEYVEQKQQLGTAHALKLMNGKVKGKFLVLSGDNIIEPATIAKLVQEKPDAILVKEQENISKYGVIEAQNGIVTCIVEKPKEILSHLVNTGVYAFTDDIFNSIGQETDLTSVIRNMIDQGHKIKTCEAAGAWLDVVYPWDILKLNDLALAKISPAVGGIVERGASVKGLVSIGKGTTIRSNSYIVGPAIIGENCEIGPSVCILPIDRGCRLKGHFVTQSGEADIKVEGEYNQVNIGAMLGEHCSVGDSVVTAPGVIMGNRCRVKALKVLEQSIPDESLVV